jgi:hypothetical protein
MATVSTPIDFIHSAEALSWAVVVPNRRTGSSLRCSPTATQISVDPMSTPAAL